jgi:hypothetical protein
VSDRILLQLPMRVNTVVTVMKALAELFPGADCSFGDDGNMVIEVPDEVQPVELADDWHLIADEPLRDVLTAEDAETYRPTKGDDG